MASAECGGMLRSAAGSSVFPVLRIVSRMSSESIEVMREVPEYGFVVIVSLFWEYVGISLAMEAGFSGMPEVLTWTFWS